MIKRQAIFITIVFTLAIVLVGSIVPTKLHADTIPKAPVLIDTDGHAYTKPCAVQPGQSYDFTWQIFNNGSAPIYYDSLTLFRCNYLTSAWSVMPPPCSVDDFYVMWNEIGIQPGESWTCHASILVSQTAPIGEWVYNYYFTEHGGNSTSALTRTLIGESCPNSWGNTPWAYEVGCPIQASNGENFQHPSTDMNLGGPLSLTFSRYYASGLEDDGLVDSSLGGNWMHNFDRSIITTNPASPIVVDDLGQSLVFVQNWLGGDISYDLNFKEEPVPYKLKNDNGGNLDYWFLDPATQLIYRFDVDGRLEEILDRNENKLTVTRGGSNRITQVADGSGRSLTFTYDGGGSLEMISDGSRTFAYGYDTNDNLVSSTDPMNNVTNYYYDPILTHGPLLTDEESPEGTMHYTNTYNTQGQVIQQQDAYANLSILDYGTPSADQTTVTDPTGTTHIYTHNGNLGTDLQDQAGNTFTRNFDDKGRPISVDDRIGGKTRITWDDVSGQIASIINAGSEVLNYTYTPQEQMFINPDTAGTVSFTFYDLTQIDYPDGTNRQFTYDEQGNLLINQDQSGNDTYYSYDGMGNVLTFANPGGGSGTNTYNANGTLASSTNSDIGTTDYEYDSFNRLVEIEHPGGSSVQMTYNHNDQVTSITDELNNNYSYEYDSNGNLINAIDPTLENTQYAYDLMDRIDQTINRLDDVTAYTYDNMGRMESVTSPGSVTATYGYDDRGWSDQVTVDGKTWKTTYNDEGIPVSDTTPEGRTTTYQSNELGYLTKVIRPGSLTTTLTRDNMSRITQVNDPLNRITNYSYDNRGMLDSVTLPVIGSTAYQYDSLGALVRITDLNGNDWDFGYTGMGLLNSGTDPLGNNTGYSYDNRGRLDDIDYANGDSCIYLYDATSNITSAWHTGGPSINYSYDPLNRLDTTDSLNLEYDIEGRTINAEDSGSDFGATYDDDGRIETVTYDSFFNFHVNYTYDPDNGRLTSVSDSYPSAQVDFSYDNDGLLTSMTRSNGVNGTFTYDDAGRLERIQEGTIIDLNYTLDDAGQVTEVDMANIPLAPWDCVTTENDTFTYDAASQVNSSGYIYDTRGRRTNAPAGTNYNWDGASRLTEIDTADLTYNGIGGLVTHTQLGNTTHYYRNYALGLAPIVAEEDDTASAFHRYYVWTPGGKLLYMIDPQDSNEAYFYHFDRTGSTLALTDSGGAVTDKYAYTPYGTLLQHDGANDQPFTFVGSAGVRQEGESGTLYQMRARYYDATTASFLSREPLWPLIGDPQQLNPYQYGLQQPINNVDPTGLAVSGDLWEWDTLQRNFDTSVNNVAPTGSAGSEWASLDANYGKPVDGINPIGRSVLNDVWEWKSIERNYVRPAKSVDDPLGNPGANSGGYDALTHGGNYQSNLKLWASLMNNTGVGWQYPAGQRAGWGYMMLTNFLPQSQQTVKPFGAIDTPTYNQYRSDVASLFPGYANSNGTADYFDMDTTAYANGVHTIHWTASDSGENTDGIGSRYFTIQNSGR